MCSGVMDPDSPRYGCDCHLFENDPPDEPEEEEERPGRCQCGQRIRAGDVFCFDCARAGYG